MIRCVLRATMRPITMPGKNVHACCSMPVIACFPTHPCHSRVQAGIQLAGAHCTRTDMDIFATAPRRLRSSPGQQAIHSTKYCVVQASVLSSHPWPGMDALLHSKFGRPGSRGSVLYFVSCLPPSPPQRSSTGPPLVRVPVSTRSSDHPDHQVERLKPSHFSDAGRSPSLNSRVNGPLTWCRRLRFSLSSIWVSLLLLYLLHIRCRPSLVFPLAVCTV